MLLLSRKKDEQIILTVPPSNETRRIVVSVVELQRGQVRLGVKAPKSVIVDRAEIDVRRNRDSVGPIHSSP